MPTLDEIRAKANAAKQSFANLGQSNASPVNSITIKEPGNTVPSEKLNSNNVSNDGNQKFDTGNREYQGSGVYSKPNAGINEQSNSDKVLHGVLPEGQTIPSNSKSNALIDWHDNGNGKPINNPVNDLPDDIKQPLAENDNIIRLAEINAQANDLSNDIIEDDGSINIQAVLAKEFNSTEEDIELFRRIYIATGQSVIKLSITELSERITHCQKAIKIIEALQQACVRVKKDKLDNESSADRVKRLEADKAYKPKKRAKNVDATGAIMPVKMSAREKLIEKFMKSGMSRQKAEQLLDED